MAQRKSPPSGKSSSRPGGKPGAKTAGRTPTKAAGASSARPPSRKKPKSIVNQKQRPWGLIVTAAVIVVFAAAIVAVVIATRPDNNSSDAASTSKGGQSVDSSDRWRQPALAAAMAIKGVTYRVEGQHTHVEGTIKYDSTPPVGGNHNQYWADCTGTVYDQPIANENAVHMLEHGAVWITYNADQIKGTQLAKLKTYVAGIDRMALSPYPDLSTPISLQAWGYQLKLSSPDDPRIAEFIKTLKYNQKTTPEPGATCSQPDFKQKPSSFGKPTDPYAA